MSTRRSVSLATAVLGAAFVAWLVTVQRMEGMNGGPGTDLGALGWYVGVWVTMMAAMMLPAVLPVVLLYARVSSERTRRGVAAVGTPVFLAGYLAVWTAFSLLATLLQVALEQASLLTPMMASANKSVSAAVLVAAGIYQWLPLKQACLRNCRNPVQFFVARWRRGVSGAFRMGAVSGAYCVGCCWVLMLLLFVAGIMNLLWVALIAGFVLVERLLPAGRVTSSVAGVALALSGLALLIKP